MMVTLELKVMEIKLELVMGLVKVKDTVKASVRGMKWAGQVSRNRWAYTVHLMY